jgi:hypothetical protein
MRSAIAAILTLGAVLNASAGPHPITVTTSNGVPIITGQQMDTNFVMTTNAQPYAYDAGLAIAPGNPPVLQWTDSQHMLVSCATNDECYLYGATSPNGPWWGIAPVTNGCVVPVWTPPNGQFQQMYFVLQVMPVRYYLQILQGPNGEWPTNAFLEPQWELPAGVWYQLKITNGFFNVDGNSYVGLEYPASVLSGAGPTNWPCAMVVESYETTNKGAGFWTNYFWVDKFQTKQFFDVSFYQRLPFVPGYPGVSSTNDHFPKWQVSVPCATNTVTLTNSPSTNSQTLPSTYIVCNTNTPTPNQSQLGSTNAPFVLYPPCLVSFSSNSPSTWGGDMPPLLLPIGPNPAFPGTPPSTATLTYLPEPEHIINYPPWGTWNPHGPFAPPPNQTVTDTYIPPDSIMNGAPSYPYIDGSGLIHGTPPSIWDPQSGPPVWVPGWPYGPYGEP